MTSGDRYQQYWMDTSDTQVCFFRKAKTEKGVLVHELEVWEWSTFAKLSETPASGSAKVGWL